MWLSLPPDQLDYGVSMKHFINSNSNQLQKKNTRGDIPIRQNYKNT